MTGKLFPKENHVSCREDVPSYDVLFNDLKEEEMREKKDKPATIIATQSAKVPQLKQKNKEEDDSDEYEVCWFGANTTANDLAKSGKPELKIDKAQIGQL